MREESYSGPDDAREGDARSVLKAVEELELFLGRNAYVSRLGDDDDAFACRRWEVQTGKMMMKISGLAICFFREKVEVSLANRCVFGGSRILESRDDHAPDEVRGLLDADEVL